MFLADTTGGTERCSGRGALICSRGVGGVQPAKCVCAVIVCAAVFRADKDRGRDGSRKCGGPPQKKSTKDLCVCAYPVQGDGVSVFFSRFLSVSLVFGFFVLCLAHQRGFDRYLLNFECPL
jgi:hypothetical protein